MLLLPASVTPILLSSCLSNQVAKTNLLGSFRRNFTGLKFPEQLHWGLHVAAWCFSMNWLDYSEDGSYYTFSIYTNRTDLHSDTWVSIHGCTLAVVVNGCCGNGVRGDTGALVGGYSQYLYGAINQWGDTTLKPRGKAGVNTGSKQIGDIVGGWGCYMCRWNVTS